MRLPRKLSRALPTEEVLSPAAAAQQAAQGGIRTAIVAGAAAGVVGQEMETQRRLNAAEDRIRQNNIITAARARFDEWEADPRYEMDVQPDGRSTPDVMSEEAQALRGEIMEMTESIQNPLERERFQAAMNNTLDLVQPDINRAVTNRRMGIVMKQGKAAAEAAAKVGDFDRAKDIYAGLGEQFQSVADQMPEILDALEKERVQYEGGKIADMGRKAYQMSFDEGERFFEDLFKREMDTDVQNAAISALNGIREAARKAHTREREAEETVFINRTTDDIRNPPPLEVIESRARGDYYGEGPTGARRRAQVLAAYDTRSRKATVKDSISLLLNSGQMLPEGKQYREALDLVMADKLEGLEGEERLETMVNTFRAAGTVSESAANMLRNASKSTQTLAAALPLFMALSEGDAQPDMHIDADTRVLLEDAASQVDAGGDLMAAAEATWDSVMNIDEKTREARADIWNEQSDGWVKDGASDLRKETGKRFANTETERIYDQQYAVNLERGFMLTGTQAGAERYASQEMRKQFVLSNLNGKPTVTRWGIPGDSTPIRESMNAAFSDMELVQSTGEGWKMGPGESDEIEYRVVRMDGADRMIAPFMNGQPMMLQSDEGWQVAEYRLTPTEMQQSIESYGVLMGNIRQLEKSERRQRQLESILNSPRGIGANLREDFIRQELADLEQEQEELMGRTGVTERVQQAATRDIEGRINMIESLIEMSYEDEDQGRAASQRVQLRKRLDKLRAASGD